MRYAQPSLRQSGSEQQQWPCDRCYRSSTLLALLVHAAKAVQCVHVASCAAPVVRSAYVDDAFDDLWGEASIQLHGKRPCEHPHGHGHSESANSPMLALLLAHYFFNARADLMSFAEIV